MLRTLSPLKSTDIATCEFPLDLHVLSTPPAFVLSQNQTLRKKSLRPAPPRSVWISGRRQPDRFHVELAPSGLTDGVCFIYSKLSPTCVEENVGSHVSHISVFKERLADPAPRDRRNARRDESSAVSGEMLLLLKNFPDPLAGTSLYSSRRSLSRAPRQNLRHAAVTTTSVRGRTSYQKPLPMQQLSGKIFPLEKPKAIEPFGPARHRPSKTAVPDGGGGGIRTPDPARAG